MGTQTLLRFSPATFPLGYCVFVVFPSAIKPASAGCMRRHRGAGGEGPSVASSEVTRNTSGARPSPRPSPYFSVKAYL